VTDAETAKRAVDAGAEFIVTPCVVRQSSTPPRRANVAVLPGALTADRKCSRRFALAATMVKVFSGAERRGAAYLRRCAGPFPDIPLVPTGGVTIDNIAELFQAGRRGGPVSD